MKKFSWILALFAALALLFIGCPSPGGDDDDDGDGLPTGNPIVEDANYITVTKRVNSWDGIDVRNANPDWGDNAAGWTASKAHTMVIQGWAGVGGSVILAAGETGTVLNQAYADNDGMFKIDKELSWDQINSNKDNFRIQGPATTKAFILYEITITDADGALKYKLSTDTEIQSMDHGTSVNWSNKVGTKWFFKSGGPEITVLDPSKIGQFVAATGIDGVPSAGKVNVEITLPTEASPSAATNKAVTWTIKTDGGTESVLDGNKLTPKKAGTVTITGTVVKGKSETENFAENYDIEITAPAVLGGSKVVMTFGAATQDITLTATGGTVNYFADSTGYQFTHTADWQGAWTKFAITLPAGSVKTYGSVTLDVEPIYPPSTGLPAYVGEGEGKTITEAQYIGRYQYKNIGLLVDLPTLTVGSVEPLDFQITDYPQVPLDVTAGKKSVVLKFDAKKIKRVADNVTVEMSIYLHGRIDTVYQFSNIKFVAGGGVPCADCDKFPCICFDCGCNCANCLTEGECDGTNCAAACECTCHFDWSTVTDPMTLTIAADETELGNAFSATGAATMAMDGSALKMTFTGTEGTFDGQGRGKIGWIKLSEEQEEILIAAATAGGKEVKINIQGSVSTDAPNFRICLGKIDTGASWNGSTWVISNEAFANAVGEKTIEFNGNSIGQMDNEDNPGSRLSYLIFQEFNKEGVGVDSVLTITSVTITVVAPE